MNALMRRFRHVRATDQHGVTLIELLVTMMLVTLVMGFVGTFAVQTLKITRKTEQRQEDAAEVRTAITQIDRAVRTARGPSSTVPAFPTAGPTEVVFYAQLDNAGTPTTRDGSAPKRVRIYLDTSGPKGVLIQEITPAAASSVPPNYVYTAAPQRRVLARGVVNAAADPIFRFFSDAGGEFGSPVTAANRNLIASVEVDLRVHKGSDRTVPAIVQTAIRLPNYNNT